MAEETTPLPSPPEPAPEPTPEPTAEAQPPAKKAAAKAKPPAEGDAPAKPKKEKPPAIEDKPFNEFMEQHFAPALKAALAAKGAEDVAISLSQSPLPLTYGGTETYWQLRGDWQDKQKQFNLYFLDGDISGKKAFSYSSYGKSPSTLESFMIDERKVTLDLMVLYAVQRLNGQKWFGDN